MHEFLSEGQSAALLSRALCGSRLPSPTAVGCGLAPLGDTQLEAVHSLTVGRQLHCSQRLDQPSLLSEPVPYIVALGVASSVYLQPSVACKPLWQGYYP
jgi:hypothetical protein